MAPAAAPAPAAAAAEMRPPSDVTRTRSRVERFQESLYPGVNTITSGPTTTARRYPRPMRVYWSRKPITALKVDAIVNAAKPSLMGGGGVDGAIHAAAGPRLRQACALLGGCPVGEVRLTPGFDLPAKYVIHTVGPHGSDHAAADLLRRCYLRALDMAVANNLGSIAFPCISAGIYGFEPEAAAKIALAAVEEWGDEGSNGLRLDEIVFALFTEAGEELYLQLWPTAFYYRLLDGHEPSAEALQRLLTRGRAPAWVEPVHVDKHRGSDWQRPSWWTPLPEHVQRAHELYAPAVTAPAHVRTITVTGSGPTERREDDEVTSGTPGQARTCRSARCGRPYFGTKRQQCPHCGLRGKL